MLPSEYIVTHGDRQPRTPDAHFTPPDSAAELPHACRERRKQRSDVSLTDSGCEFGLGYLFGQALPISETFSIIASTRGAFKISGIARSSHVAYACHEARLVISLSSETCL